MVMSLAGNGWKVYLDWRDASLSPMPSYIFKATGNGRIKHVRKSFLSGGLSRCSVLLKPMTHIIVPGAAPRLHRLAED